MDAKIGIERLREVKMAKINKNRKFHSDNFERIRRSHDTGQEALERDMERRNRNRGTRSSVVQNEEDDFYSSYED